MKFSRIHRIAYLLILSSVTLFINFTLALPITGVITYNGSPLQNVQINVSPGTNTAITNSLGQYSVTVTNGIYTVTPQLAGYSFTPVFQTVTVPSGNQTANFTATLNSVNISGNINVGGSPLANVQLSLSGSTSGSTATDASGNYSFSVNYGGSYVVTPQLTGYSFTPPTLAFAGITSNQTANFTATPNNVTISGKITVGGSPLPDVQLSLSGSTSGSTTTNSSGDYSFSVASGGSYVITPQLAGYSFTPPTASFASVTSNKTGDFTATPNNVTISGRITVGGSPLQNVQLNLTGSTNGTATTNSNGEYSFSVASGGSYVITPQLTGYSFTPPTAAFTNVTSNKTADFTAAINTLIISGIVKVGNNPLANVQVALTGTTTGTTTTNESGQYSFTVASGGSYVVTPQLAGYSFTPPTAALTNVTSNQTANFAAVLNNIIISGNIKADGISLSGALVVLSGTVNSSATTDQSGNYSFTVAYGGSYTLTPQKEGYSFDPPIKALTNVITNTEVNFTASAAAITLRGAITYNGAPLSGVNVILIGTAVDSIITGTDGLYTFTVSKGGSYTVTPYKPGYAFNPNQASYLNVQQNQIKDFIATTNTVTISGHITSKNSTERNLLKILGSPLSNIKVYLSGTAIDSATTDEAGYYKFTVLQSGSYIITPFKIGMTFTPQFRPFVQISSNAVGDFQGEPAVPINLLPIIDKKNTSTNPRFIWLYAGDKGNNLTFHIQVSTEPSITIIDFEKSGIKDSSVVIKGLKKGTKYYWHVRAERGTENSSWSISTDFTTSNEKALTIEPLDNEDLGGRLPLFLIHGWNYTGSPAPNNAGYWDNFIGFYNSQIKLKNAYKIYLVKYYSNWYNVNELAGFLRDEIQILDSRSSNFASKEIVILAHSMGGLISRSLMQEYSFTQGTFGGRACGDRIKTLIAFGTPHHGSPIANGPARDAKIRPALSLAMNAIEYTVFTETRYNDANRTDLHWDNFDNLLNYTLYSEEANSWLTAVNGSGAYDGKVICYAGKTSGALSNPPYSGTVVYDIGSYILNQDFSLENDGIVPYLSAIWQNHSPMKIHTLDGYNHDEIVKGKGDNVLFNLVLSDLMEFAPFSVTKPNGNELLKNGTNYKIRWSAPKSITAVDIYYSPDNGNTFLPVTLNYPTDNGGEYNWTVPDTNSANCLLKVVNHNNQSDFDLSDSTFHIYHNWICFTYQIGQDTIFERQDIAKLTWAFNGIGQKVKISFADNSSGAPVLYPIETNIDINSKQYNWNIPSTAPITKKGNLIIEILELDSICQNSSKNIYIYPKRKLTILKPNGGEELWIDSIYNIQFRLEGNINKLTISYKDSIGVFYKISDTLVKGSDTSVMISFSWKIPMKQGGGFSLKINDFDRTDNSDISDKVFALGYKGPKLSFPAADASLTDCGFFVNSETENLDGTAITQLGTDSTFRTNTRNYTGIGYILIKNLPLNTTYYWRSKRKNSSWETFWSETRKFTVGSWIPKNTPELLSPANNSTDLQSNNNFKWKRNCEATAYQFQIGLDQNFTALEKDTLIRTNFGFFDYDIDTISLAYTVKNDNVPLYWRVRFNNSKGYGAWSNSFQFKTMDPCMKMTDVTVCSDGWLLTDTNTYKSTGPVRIGNYITLENGYVIVNKNKSEIINAQGLLKFTTTLRTLELFSGSFTLKNNIMTPAANVIVKLAKENLGQLTADKLLIKQIKPVSGEVFLNYTDRIIPMPISGIKMEGQVAIKVLTYGDFEIKQDGSIAGTVVGMNETVGHLILEISDIKFNLTKISLEGNIDLAYINAYNVILDLGGLNFTGEEGYLMKNVLIKITPTDQISFCNKKDGKWECGALQQIPDFGVCDFKFESPKVLFEYLNDEKCWALTGKGTIILPFKFTKQPGFRNKLGACFISTEFQIYSKNPYLHKVGFSLEGCVQVPVAPGLWFTGFGGSLTLRSNNEGTLTSGALGGHLTFDVGDGTWPPLLRGGPAFNIDSRGVLELTGKVNLLGFIPLGNASILIDIQDKNAMNIGLKADWEIVPRFPYIVGGLEGKIELKNSLNGAPLSSRMFFRGYARTQIPGKVINIWGLDLPPSSVTLQGTYIQAGEFRDYGLGAQFGIHVFTYCWLNSHGTWKPWKWTWDCRDVNACVFIPFSASRPRFGFNMYDLITFRRSTAERRKKNVSLMKNVVSFQSNGIIDTLKFNVSSTSTANLMFAINYKSETRPDMKLLSPTQLEYQSKDFIERSKGSVFDSSYVMGVETETGIWTAIISNINSKADYNVSIGGMNIEPELSIKSVEQVSDSKVSIHYTSGDPDDQALISFYYAKDDTSIGRLINDDGIIERDADGEYLWDIRNVLAGTYNIYGIISDGKNTPVTSRFNQTISINPKTAPNVVSNLKVTRDSSKILLYWDDDPVSQSFEIFLGNSSQQYYDTLKVHENYLNIEPDSSSQKYFASVRALDINNQKSFFSKEVSFSLNELNLDVTPPAAPAGLKAKGIFEPPANSPDSVIFKPCIMLNWDAVSDATGYIISYRQKEYDTPIDIYSNNQNSITINGLDAGKTYIISARSFDEARNLSFKSNEISVDLFDVNDKDHDGMPDGQEVRYFGSIEYTDDPNTDPDGDGLSIIYEMSHGTNPNNRDTDGDGIWDDVDSNPLLNFDANGNGMPDDWEAYYNVSDPNGDPDHDGLSNLEEWNYGAKPNNPDTDGGGLSDGDEVRLHRNPLDSSDDLWDGKPSAVVSKLNALQKRDTIILSWKSTNESFLQGFNLYRRDNNSGAYRLINDSLITPPKDTMKSHEYIYYDTLVAYLTSYDYILESFGKFKNIDTLAKLSLKTANSINPQQNISSQNFELFQNYPNPFNSSTNIVYQLSAIANKTDIHVKIIVYNSLGQVIRILLDEHQNPGKYRVTWDGKDSNNRSVSSGVYYYHIQADGIKYQRSMLLLR